MERDRLGYQQLDASSHVDKPSEQQEVIPLVYVYPYLHGIEIERTDAKIYEPHGFQYENTCFQALLQREKKLFLLGPHLVNFIFQREDVGDLFHPDIVGLKKQTENEWLLKRLFEIKLHENHVTKKLNGFSRLLKILRRREIYFSTYVSLFLSEAIGSQSSPSHITIPQDEEIDVYFVTPLGHEPDVFPKTRFIVDSLNIPYSPPSPPSPFS